MTDNELHFILDAIRHTVKNAEKWKKDYCYDKHTNEFYHCKFPEKKDAEFSQWFTLTWYYDSHNNIINKFINDLAQSIFLFIPAPDNFIF